MTTSIFRAPLAVLPLALAAAFPSLAQAQSNVLLGETVVTAMRFPESAAALPLGVNVITADDIQRSGSSTVNEAVMKLLGIPGRLDTSGGNNYTLDLRGFGEAANSNQIVIVDGLRLNEADLSAAGLAHISIDSVEKIEVMRGTGSVLYGEGATGGVIVVTTKAGASVKRVNAAQLYAATGSHGLQDLRANAVLVAGGFSLDIAADDRHSDGHRENFASVAKGMAVTGQWSNDWLRLGARAGQHSLDSGLPGSLTPAQYEADSRLANPTSKTDVSSIKKDNAGVFIEASIGDWLLAADANQRTKKYLTSASWGLYGYDVDATNYSARARHEDRVTIGTNALLVGYDNGAWTSTSTTSPIGKVSKADSSAYYIKDDLTLTSTGSRLSVGWRTEEMKKNKSINASLSETQNAWELGVSQPVTKDVLVYGRVGSSYRLGNVDEFSFTTPGQSLMAQTSRDLEFGTRLKLAAGQVDVRWYRNELNNEIGYDPTAVGPSSIWGFNGANINFDPTRRQGVELDVNQVINSALDLRLNAALRQATFTSGVYAGNTVPLVPSQTLALHMNWRPLAGHSVDGGLNWVSSQKPGGDFLNKFSVPAYTTLDVRYAYQFRNAELALGVANLLDVKYYSQAYLNTAGTDVGIYPEAGRTFTASLRLKF